MKNIYKPYEDIIISDKTIIRTFKGSSYDELWHRDKEDRKIEVIQNDGWMFQYDNELPILLNTSIFISKQTWHRIIKGQGILKIKITKL